MQAFNITIFRIIAVSLDENYFHGILSSFASAINTLNYSFRDL